MTRATQTPMVVEPARSTTMRERWKLGAPFSAREASAPSFSSIFTLTSPRTQEDWPEITPRPVAVMHESIAPLDAPLGLLGKSLLLAVLTLAKDLGKPVPGLNRNATITGAEGLALGHEILGDLFPKTRDESERPTPTPTPTPRTRPSVKLSG